MNSGGRAGRLAGLLGAILALVAGPGQSAGDWRLTHWSGLGCGVEQIVMGRATGATLVEAMLFPQGDGAMVLMRVPTGAWLADGIAYRHSASDTAAVGLVWQACSARRCAALAQIDTAELGRLLAGREIIVGYRPTRESPALNVPVSLRGLTRAWTGLPDCAGGD